MKTYLVNGFLDSGKTTFIKDLLHQDYFATGEPTLLLLCEEGEIEYDADDLKANRIYPVEIESERDFSSDHIAQSEKELSPTRVVIEFNGMWQWKNVTFPAHWDKPISITLFHAGTFEMYLRNMKPLVAEQVRNASLVIFNRCDAVMDKLPSFRRNVRAVNAGASIIFEDKNGEISSRFEEDLPYDVGSGEIEINDAAYGLFYLDAMENVDRYFGKVVSLSGMVIKKKSKDPNTVILGRLAMTCCAEDLTLFGFICDCENPEEMKLHSWVTVRAIVGKEYSEKYQIWYPVLTILSCKPCESPENEVVDIV